MRIESAADHLDLIPTIARWHWDEWGHADPHGSLESWTEGLRGRTHRDGIPTTLVALRGDELLGSVTLVAHDMPDRPELAHLTPWVAGTFVRPEERGRGVGRALMEAAAATARSLGVSTLYLYTSTARPFYERLGWRVVAETSYEGEDVAVMSVDL